jgi:hypothetical protein
MKQLLLLLSVLVLLNAVKSNIAAIPLLIVDLIGPRAGLVRVPRGGIFRQRARSQSFE